MALSSLWQPFTLGRLELPHRLALAPMTRNRAHPDGTPGGLAAMYYGQISGFGSATQAPLVAVYTSAFKPSSAH
ncbi:oxidoreductase [Arthrobacter glacialis]|uniref:oxidoreductase n=1 Tax=Arthrobacter glacialis TaxID=1664 RepID=UPI001FAF4362|nr:hypothetical protein [Arthrobacter glacialis]